MRYHSEENKDDGGPAGSGLYRTDHLYFWIDSWIATGHFLRVKETYCLRRRSEDQGYRRDRSGSLGEY